MPRGQKNMKRDDSGSFDGSDDNALTSAIIKQMESKWEKSRKTMESKLEKALERDLENILDKRRLQFARSVDNMTKLYDIFQKEYAVIDDKIRAAWVEVIAQLDKRLAASEREASAFADEEEMRSEEHYQAITLQHAAIDAMDRQIRSMMNRIKDL